MLTRREVLLQLKRVGVIEASQMKVCLRDFEKYLAENHSVVMAEKGENLKEGKSTPHSTLSVYWEAGGRVVRGREKVENSFHFIEPGEG